MGVPKTSFPPEIVVDDAKQTKFQEGSWINKTLYKSFYISKRLFTSI